MHGRRTVSTKRSPSVLSLQSRQRYEEAEADGKNHEAGDRHSSINMAMKATPAKPISAGMIAVTISAGVRLADDVVPIAVDGGSVWGDMALTSGG